MFIKVLYKLYYVIYYIYYYKLIRYNDIVIFVIIIAKV